MFPFLFLFFANNDEDCKKKFHKYCLFNKNEDNSNFSLFMELESIKIYGMIIFLSIISMIIRYNFNNKVRIVFFFF